MELPRRKPHDVHLPDGSLTEAMSRLREFTEAHDLRIGIVYAFDFRTRMLPYWYADKLMAPASVRTLGDVLHASGFRQIRIVLQQWTPNFRPSEAKLDGGPLDILLVSGMQVHAEPAYDLIRDAHRMGAERPLIIAGGPKAIYEPADYFELGPDAGVGADCAVTGEAFVLLELLQQILEHWTPAESVRSAFEAARRSGSLEEVLGLVYLSPDASPGRPVAVNTGVQRILRDLDEMPMPDAGYRMLERPHRGQGLREKPCTPRMVGKRSIISSIVATQGCKFRCSFCPIPSVNQRTWRHKSPERFAAEIKHLYENFGIREFFGTDDNFFNRRETVIAMMTQLARTTTGGVRLSERVSFYTEATQFDVYKNRDLLPLCRKGGLSAIWFGLEDLTGGLVDKGQSQSKTEELFAYMHKIGIQPMALMIHSDDQPLRSRRGDMSGLLNQARYVFEQGAVSYQCTYLGPAVGTRDFEPAAIAGKLYRSVGGRDIPQAYQDGNHVVASRHSAPWQRQMNILRAYATFYNPMNVLRILGTPGKRALAKKRLLFQLIGQIGILMTLPKLLRWARKLKRGPIEVWDGLQPARIPMVDAATGQEMDWAIEHLRSDDLSIVSSSPAKGLHCEGLGLGTETRPVLLARKPTPVTA
ncbi:MAG: radical SAM protein [Phycisphaerae bacterium]|nr:radical SAM protein [Phycisphaerae bacterium]